MELFLRTLLRLSLLGSILALALTVLRPLLRGRVSRRTAYYLWLLVLLRLCLPVGIALPAPAELEPFSPAAQAAPVEPVNVPANLPGVSMPAESGPPPAAASVASVVPPEPAVPAVPAVPALATPSPAGRLRGPEWLVILWAVGAAASIGWFTLGYRRASRVVRQSAVGASPAARGILRELDPTGRVRLVESPAVNTPLLLGAVRPVIVLPAGVTDEARLRDILAHELTHVQRHDLLFKWFAAVATSLHWFNPVMLLVRREIGRACELSCDEAVISNLDEAGRRHYGETLLSMAAHAPKGLGSMAVTLCEEKKQLKERLFCIVKYKKSGPMVVFLSLLLAAVLGACSLVTGVRPVTPDEPEPPVETENEPQEKDTDPPVIYELDGGLTIAFPADIVDQLIIEPGNGDEYWDDLIRVYEKQSYDDTLADWGSEGGGFLFGITRFTQERYEENYLGGDDSGVSPFAADGACYYVHTFATDVQFYRSGIENYADVDFSPWQQLEERVDGILDDFVVRNGLEPFQPLHLTAEALYRHIIDPKGGDQYDFIARVEHNGQTDEFHVTPENGNNVAFVGNYFFTYAWQEAEESEWLALKEPGTVLTLLSADGQSSIRCRSGDDLAEMVQDGTTRYVRVWDPETPEDPDPYLWPSFWAYLMNIPDDAFVAQSFDYTADGSLPPAEAARKISELWAEHERNTPDWLDWKPLDFQLESVEVFDAYYGEDPNFCFDVSFCLLLDYPNYSRWQAGAGLGDPIADGPFAGYYHWGMEVLVMKNGSGDWYVADAGTGGYLAELPGWTLSNGMANYLGNASLEEMADLFYLTEGYSHEYLLPEYICEKSAEELASLSSLLDRRSESEARELCRALAAYLNAGYGSDYSDTVTSLEELTQLLAPAYRAYTADVPPLEA